MYGCSKTLLNFPYGSSLVELTNRLAYTNAHFYPVERDARIVPRALCVPRTKWSDVVELADDRNKKRCLWKFKNGSRSIVKEERRR